jgi:phosphatidylserine decarboxylase
MLSIHKEGTSILIISFIILGLLNFGLIKFVPIPRWSMKVVLIVTLLLYLWIIYFFRNPSRTITMQGDAILAPADGKIVAIEEVYEQEYLKKNCIQVSIFMSPFNVHVNRSPISGTLEYFKYHPGKYIVAFHPKSSTKNERTTAVVRQEDGTEILFRQIAGFIARRIVFYPKQGDALQQGDEVGFIKFGSRLDVFLPTDAHIEVALGDHVQGGLTVLAKKMLDENLTK